jgi:hypothetical protein
MATFTSSHAGAMAAGGSPFLARRRGAPSSSPFLGRRLTPGSVRMRAASSSRGATALRVTCDKVVGIDLALRRRVHQVRGAPRGPDRQAPGRRQPREHLLLRQALHRPQHGRGRRRGQAGLLRRPARRLRERQARLPHHREAVRRRGNICPGKTYFVHS